MKKILAVLLGLYLFVPGVNAQDDEIRQPAIGISFSMYDFQTAQKIRSTSLAQVLRDKGWADFGDMSPALGIHYFKGLKKHIDFAATLTSAFVDYPFPNKPSFGNKFLLAADVAFNFKMVSEKYWVQPYIIAGVGGHVFKGTHWGAYMPLGLGMKVNFFDEMHLFTTAQYRVPVTADNANYHFLYNLGIAGAIGKKKEPKVIPPPPPPAPPSDRDKDGVIDDKDKCPDTPGLAKYDGCPIPDSDKDGINDEEDKCPTVPGLAKYQGCPIPDTDKDGINDEEDKCPTVAGLARYQGCPVPDGDGDGVNDEEDKCPTVPGVRENFGCPVISEEVKQKVDYAAQNIYFITGSARLDKRSYKGLDEVAKIMAENPETKLTIDGHTDNVGTDALNQKLSESRAASVKTYLVSKGVDESRLTSTGYGETQPVADNKTAAGRTKNRRVEMKLSY
jgi:OOP family OmpA-OmpF porin